MYVIHIGGAESEDNRDTRLACTPCRAGRALRALHAVHAVCDMDQGRAARFPVTALACRYASGGYCVDRINSNTPKGTMRVGVVGILRAAGGAAIWAILTNPVLQWISNLLGRLKGKPKASRSGAAPWEDLPAWWKDLPDGRLRDAEGYYE